MKEKSNITTAENLRMLRESYHYTQAEVSKYLGISQPAYLKYEKGTVEPSMEAIEKLATLYGVDEFDLVEGNSEALQTAVSFAFRKDPSTDNLEDIAHFQKIIKNYIMMTNELEDKQV